MSVSIKNKVEANELDITYLADHKLEENSRSMLATIVQETQKLQDKAHKRWAKLQNELIELYYMAPGMRFTTEFQRKKMALEQATIQWQGLELYKREVMAAYKAKGIEE